MKRLILFIPLLIALSSISQTASLPIDTARKFCYTRDEANFLISSVFTAETYIGITDSLFFVIDSMAQDKDDLKELNKDCNKLNQSYKKVLKKKNLAVYLWEGISGAIASAWVYREIKRLYQ